MMEIKVNLGCGKTDFGPGWFNGDLCNYSHIDFHDIENIPFRDNSVSVVYASHVLEYFNREDGKLLLLF